MPHFPDNIMTALKETIINIFWTKRDLRALLNRCGVPRHLIEEQDWDAYKYHIVAPVLDALNENDSGLGPLRQILQETLRYTDGSHLLRWPDGQKRKREAERCLEHLRLLVKDHDAAVRTAEEEKQARRRQAEQARKGAAFCAKLAQLKERFLSFYSEQHAQQRGYMLEKLLYDIFDLFELEPRGAFKIKGEQIDGAFVLDGDNLLLEAKWQEAPASLNDLRDLDGAVGSGIETTLGLFVSINGFSQDGLQRYREGGRPRIICMDGSDLMTVLEGQMDLRDLLRRKRSIAAKGTVFVRAGDILLGRE
ncbi:MAG: hypothetical protein GTO55_11005 [Armatimonadetes bacterium]|nr:hypothetical protein [Armatimonadota bacterium]NIN06839.1 hypothetical protein [Armatimonadota bacterium]NIT32136.1 hypothetical protein [Armatimonadota bacterium]